MSFFQLEFNATVYYGLLLESTSKYRYYKTVCYFRKKQTNSLSIVLVLDNFITTRLNFIKQNLLEIKIWKIIFDIKKNLSMR